MRKYESKEKTQIEQMENNLGGSWLLKIRQHVDILLEKQKKNTIKSVKGGRPHGARNRRRGPRSNNAVLTQLISNAINLEKKWIY